MKWSVLVVIKSGLLVMYRYVGLVVSYLAMSNWVTQKEIVIHSGYYQGWSINSAGPQYLMFWWPDRILGGIVANFKPCSEFQSTIDTSSSSTKPVKIKHDGSIKKLLLSDFCVETSKPVGLVENVFDWPCWQVDFLED